jgi:replicative DNA helicase
VSIAEKVFLGSLIKAEYLLKDTVIKPEQLESKRHQELMRRMMELTRVGRNIDLISLTTLPDLANFGGMSYLSELLSFADLEKFENTEKLILHLWKEREKRNILTLAAMNDWEIEKVTTELDRINLLKVEDHTSLTQALADVYETPWEDPIVVNKSTTGIQRGSTS